MSATTDHDPAVGDLLEQLYAQLDTLRDVRAPNLAIPNFDMPLPAFYTSWKIDLQSAGRDALIARLSDFDRGLKIPRVRREDGQQEHREIRELLVECQALVHELIAEAKARGYPYDAPVIVNAAEFVPEIDEIRNDIRQMKAMVEGLDAARRNVLSGVTISVGNFGISVAAIVQAVKLAGDMLASGPEIDVRALSKALADIAEIAGTTARQAAESGGAVAQDLVENLREIARFAVALARKGFKLLEEVLGAALRDPGAPLRSALGGFVEGISFEGVLRTSWPMAVDLGTTNSLVYVKGRGVVLNEPTVVAMRNDNGKRSIRAIGYDARFGRRLGDEIVQPVRDGVVADFEVAEEMIRYFVRKIHSNPSLARPVMILCAPVGATSIERRALQESALAAGASRTYLIEAPMAAAIGAGLPVSYPTTSVIVSIGSGITEIAAISLGQIVASRSLRSGGDAMNKAIVAYLHRRHRFLAGETQAEKIKREIGTALAPPHGHGETIAINGLDSVRRTVRTMTVTQSHVAEAVGEQVRNIVAAVRDVLDAVGPEQASDIIENGIVLAGGGALLSKLDTVIGNATGLRARYADDPVSCAILGAGRILENMKLMRYVLSTAF